MADHGQRSSCRCARPAATHRPAPIVYDGSYREIVLAHAVARALSATRRSAQASERKTKLDRADVVVRYRGRSGPTISGRSGVTFAKVRMLSALRQACRGNHQIHAAPSMRWAIERDADWRKIRAQRVLVVLFQTVTMNAPRDKTCHEPRLFYTANDGVSAAISSISSARRAAAPVPHDDLTAAQDGGR